MNQSTSNTNSALEGAANGEASTKATGQQRRYRRTSRAKSAATSQAATPVSTATPAAPAETPPPAPAKPTSARTPAAPKSDRTRGGAKAQPQATATPPLHRLHQLPKRRNRPSRALAHATSATPGETRETSIWSYRHLAPLTATVTVLEQNRYLLRSHRKLSHFPLPYPS